MTRRWNRSIATRRMRGKRPIASIESIDSIDRVDRSVEWRLSGVCGVDATTDESATGLVVDVGRGPVADASVVASHRTRPRGAIPPIDRPIDRSIESIESIESIDAMDSFPSIRLVAIDRIDRIDRRFTTSPRPPRR